MSVVWVVAVMVLVMPAAAWAGEEIPDFLEIIVDQGKAPSKAEIAADDVKALDAGMTQIYEDTLAKYTTHMRERVPVIIAMFSDTGGRMILLPPGEDPVEAPSVPPVYTWVKSVSHSTLAAYQLVAPYLENPGDTSWRLPMSAYRAKIAAARGTLPDLDLDDELRTRLDGMLEKTVSFLDQCLETGAFTLAELEAFARSVEHDIAKNVALAAKVQVDHWEGVLAGWKKKLGRRWDDTYAITNTLYVTRQNNILFTILAQEMGREAIDDRLLLVGTTDFTTTQETLLNVLVRVVADRAVGQVFFRDRRLMDAELLGGAARHAVEEDAEQKGKKALLPTLAPFDQHAWPWPTQPNSGTGASELEQIPGD